MYEPVEVPMTVVKVTFCEWLFSATELPREKVHAGIRLRFIPLLFVRMESQQ